jgi:WLM domain
VVVVAAKLTNMAFDYYKRLSAKKQSIYRQSDAIIAIPLPDPLPLQSPAQALAGALQAEDKTRVQALSQQIADGIVAQMKVPELRIQVLAVRPSDDWGELHGLYLPEEDGKTAKIQLWMRTAKHKRIVAYKSYLRTLLHEICHHLDYEHYKFPETFHTEGFYQREASLFHQLVPANSPGLPDQE